MNRQPATIYVISFITQEIEKLCVCHGYQEVEGIVSIADDDKEGSLLVSQGIKLHFVVSG